MPNHVENHIEFSGDARQIRTMLESIKTDEYGIGTIDFNKIIPMPKSLNVEAGSRTDRGLKAYRDFIEVYTFGRPAEDAKKALENIPIESESAFLRQRTDIKCDEWELGKTAWNNIRQYGAPTWYECYAKLYINTQTIFPDCPLRRFPQLFHCLQASQSFYFLCFYPLLILRHSAACFLYYFKRVVPIKSQCFQILSYTAAALRNAALL